MAKLKKRSETVGTGCLVQALGLAVGAGSGIVFPVVGWAVGIPLGLVLLVYGGRLAIKWVCTDCETAAPSKKAKVCTGCGVRFE